MRHLLSLIAGVVAAPLAWALLARGQSGAGDTVAAWAKDNAFDTVDLVVPGAYLAGAGILLGLIVSLRVSPLGPLVAALGYLGLNAGLFIDPFAVRDAIPTKILGQSIPLRTPLLNGTLLAVGALLLIAVFSAQRWRRWPATAAASPEGSAEDSAEDSAEPETAAGQQDQSAATADDTPAQPTPTGSGPPGTAGAKAAGGKVGAPPPRHAVDDVMPPASRPGDKPDSSAAPRQPD